LGHIHLALLVRFVLEEIAMFIAMNRFLVIKGAEADFEAVWLNRESHIAKEKGFIAFHLMRGPEREDHTLYSSHTMWASEEDFLAWTRSQSFRDAHKDAGQNKGLYLGSPNFEGFSVIQTVTP
jgi:heme-degrading monooxygenase HmoA